MFLFSIDYFMQSLFSCKNGKQFYVNSIKDECSYAIKRRLLDLGFTKGQAVRKIKTSLLNKVVLVEIRGYLLSLKSIIADYILLEEK